MRCHPPDSQRWAKEESEMSVSRVRAMDKVVLMGGGGVAPTVICEIRHKGEGDGEQKEDTAVLYIM